MVSALLAAACTGQVESPSEGGVRSGGGGRATEVDEPEVQRAGAGGSGGRAGAPSEPDDDADDDDDPPDEGSAASGVMDAGLVASGGTSGQSETFCDAVTQVLLPRCGGGSCHSNPDARIGDFAAGRAQAESFVDVPSVRNASCGFVIDSQDPSQSLLLRKLIGDFPVPTCGGPMPVSGGDLTDEQIDCMASWRQQFRAE